MLLFCRTSATRFPTIVPVALLLGQLLLALGLINVLTMFGMVLVIGIVCGRRHRRGRERRARDEHRRLPPLAASKAMGQISNAIVGVTVVLISVFVPLAFFGGAIGNIYRQFAAVMVSSIAFSAFMALSLDAGVVRRRSNLSRPATTRKARLLWPLQPGLWAPGARATRLGRPARAAQTARPSSMAVIAAKRPGSSCACPPPSCRTRDQATSSSTCNCPRCGAARTTLAVMQQVEDFMLKQPEG